MENKVSIVFTDKQIEEINKAQQGLDNLLTWTVPILKAEIKGARILSVDDIVNMPTAYGYVMEYPALFPNPQLTAEFKKDIDAHPFVLKLIEDQKKRLRMLEDTEIRLRQEMDDFGRYARDKFEGEIKNEPKYKSALDFFYGLFNKKPTQKPKDDK
jgi:hypothetical protein